MTELEFMEDFSDRIDYFLRCKGWSQKDLAEKSGLSKSTVSRYIKGERMPTVKALVNICCALDCDVDELILVNEEFD